MTMKEMTIREMITELSNFDDLDTKMMVSMNGYSSDEFELELVNYISENNDLTFDVLELRAFTPDLEKD